MKPYEAADMREGPATHYERPFVACSSTVAGRPCRRKAVFTSGRCTACEERESRNPFVVLDSDLPGIRGASGG